MEGSKDEWYVRVLQGACMHAWGNRGKEVGIYLNESIHAVVTAGKGKLCRAPR